MQEMQNHQLINQTSGNTEYYTPLFLIDAAYMVLGDIDLDPASSIKANKGIAAKHIFTKEDNGLTKKWYGKVWLNHPFGKSEDKCKKICTKKICKERGYHITERKPGNEDWINKLVNSYYDGEVTEALCITFYSSSERWFTPLLSFPRCVLIPRTNYYSPNGNIVKGVSKGSVITYLGKNIKLFNEVFETYGSIDVPYHMAKL
jgi:ParB family chromosome partitioning protein